MPACTTLSPSALRRSAQPRHALPVDGFRRSHRCASTVDLAEAALQANLPRSAMAQSYRERTSLAQMAALGVLVLGIVAVKVTSGH